jgi:hypothetical protein
VGLERVHVLGVVSSREQTPVDDGMQRLDATAQHLGKPGNLRDLPYGHACVA